MIRQEALKMAIRFAAATLAADDLPDRSPLPCRCEAPIGSEVAEFDAVAMHRTDSAFVLPAAQTAALDVKG